MAGPGKYYLAGFEGQRNTGPMSTTNCAAASGAMLADQATLGIKNPGVAWFRQQTDDYEGGLRAGQVAAVLEEMGIEVRLYDHRDNLKWDKLRTFLNRGWFASVAGDYDVLPPELQGADYDGFHSTVYHQRFQSNQRVGDPLLENWRKWNNALARKYVQKFDKQTSGGIHAIVIVPKFARLRSQAEVVPVREQPEKDARVIARMSGSDKLVTGGTVKGDNVVGHDRWRKVWVPHVGTGYVHYSVTWQS